MDSIFFNIICCLYKYENSTIAFQYIKTRLTEKAITKTIKKDYRLLAVDPDILIKSEMFHGIHIVVVVVYSLPSVIPPLLIAKVASLSGMFGLQEWHLLL